MIWESMTLDELAAYHRENGACVVKRCGTWWVEARPFFFRPLFPFAEIYHDMRKYPLQSAIGGVLHLVPPGGTSNTVLNLFLYDQLQEYSLDSMGTKQRWIVKKGMEHFEARRMVNPQEFISDAFEIYRNFFNRTNYFYKKERLNKAHFVRWSKTLFEHPKLVIVGAYRKGSLAAIDVSFRVEDVIIDDVFFSDTESQGLRVTDFMLHTLRRAAASSDARFLFRGFPTGKPSLDESKTRRGCKTLQLPAYCQLNPVALYLGRRFMNESYRKFVAMTSPS